MPARMTYKRICSIAAVIFIATAIKACGEEGSDGGYQDGYAVGYNNTCNVNRTTSVWGHWDNERYVRDYNSGRSAGERDCRACIARNDGNYRDCW